MIELIGYFAAFLTTINILPQALKTIKSGDTGGISVVTYLLAVIGLMFWILYGFLISNPVIIIPNAINLVLSAVILVIKIKNKR